MTDTITPASLRAHADWIVTQKGDEDHRYAADVLSSVAARLEAESARAEEAEKLAEVYRVAFKAASAGNAPNSWAVAGIRAVLDRLAADGRLLPESGELTDAVKKSLTTALDTVLSATGLSVPIPDSGPDGTPEKPWPTWQDVPDDTPYTNRSDRTGRLGHWINRDGQCFFITRGGREQPSTSSDLTMSDLAPFVRVDGDKA